MSLISCQKHNDSKISKLYQDGQKIQVVCEECLEDISFAKGRIKYEDTLLINKTMRNQEYVMKKLFAGEQWLWKFIQELKKQNQNDLIKIKQIEEFKNGFDKKINFELERFKERIKKTKDFQSKFITEILKIFDFNQLNSRLMQFQQNDEISIDFEKFQQLEKEIESFFLLIKKDNMKDLKSQMVNKIMDLKNNSYFEYKEQHIELEKMLKNLLNQQEILSYSILPIHHVQILQESQLIDDYHKFKLGYIIKERTNSKSIVSLKIFQTSNKSEINSTKFFDKVGDNKNLIMIFKSKANRIFGAFSPCICDSNLSSSDNQLSSFIFSQTYDEIYPILKGQEQKALSQKSISFSPILIFGDEDILIKSDFQGGHSKLGTSYNWSKRNLASPNSNHLFGDICPNIVQYEIYTVQLSK